MAEGAARSLAELIMTKVCSRCFCEKALTGFVPARKGLFLRSSDCRACRNEQERQRYTGSNKHQHACERRKTLACRSEKRCSRCRELKVISQFYCDKATIDGRGHACKECETSRHKTPEMRTAHAQACHRYNRSFKAKQARAKRRLIPNVKLANTIRNRMNMALKQNVKSGPTIELLGCSINSLQKYLEARFEPGMTWGNHGSGSDKWNVDHIRPCASFSDLTDPEQQKVCFHYTNLQSLWQPDNVRKGAKYV